LRAGASGPVRAGALGCIVPVWGLHGLPWASRAGWPW